MTEAGWTREKPSKEGVYWFRWGKDRDAIIVLVLIEYGDWRVMEMGHQHSGALAGYVTGEFLGPITPDSYQQGRVAGIKQGIEKLREREKFYTEQEAISEGQMRLTRGLQRNESSCCIHELEKLAQAAQDEKGGRDGK